MFELPGPEEYQSEVKKLLLPFFGKEQHEDTAVVSFLKWRCSLTALLWKENGHHNRRECFKKSNTPYKIILHWLEDEVFFILNFCNSQSC